jgi:hypothetical protein
MNKGLQRDKTQMFCFNIQKLIKKLKSLPIFQWLFTILLTSCNSFLKSSNCSLRYKVLHSIINRAPECTKKDISLERWPILKEVLFCFRGNAKIMQNWADFREISQIFSQKSRIFSEKIFAKNENRRFSRKCCLFCAKIFE